MEAAANDLEVGVEAAPPMEVGVEAAPPMEVGVEAAPPMEVCVEAAPPIRVRLEISNEISRASVQPIIDQLNAAEAECLFELHLRHNGGGCVTTMIDLIDALQGTKGQVVITFGRYIMSAAATIWLWFLVRENPNVKSLYPLKPGVVMYHRPRRIQKGEYFCFANEVDANHPLKGPLEKQFQLFDDLFSDVYDWFLYETLDGTPREAPEENLICEKDGLMYRHWLARLKDAYLGNQDCLIPV
ncbi:hypothetical protein [Pseudomonas sp. 8(2025)]|uniref:hypothetical protein n=1 Tax=Pseudomonas sp. 8(2025) TaxID=3456022 RepID=UPI00404417DA